MSRKKRAPGARDRRSTLRPHTPLSRRESVTTRGECTETTARRRAISTITVRDLEGRVWEGDGDGLADAVRDLGGGTPGFRRTT